MEFVSLGLKGADPLINNYDKVTDPALRKIKTLKQKRNRKKDRGEDTSGIDSEIEEAKDEKDGGRRDRGYAAGGGAAYEGANGYGSDGGYRRSRDRRGYQSSASDDEDYDARPRRRKSKGRSRSRKRYVEESYSRKVTGGRAKSVGRDEYFGGRGLPRRRGRGYDSDSSNGHSRSRRKSLGEQALGALGIGGLAAAAKKNLGMGSPSPSPSPPRRRRRRRHRRRSPSWSRSPSPRLNGRAATYSDNRGVDNDRDDRNYRQGKYVPAGYIGYNDGPESGNPYSDALVRRQPAASTQDLSTRPSSNYGGGGSTVSKSKKNGGSSSSESDICSSSEDERRMRKTRGKEFLTAGLAAVATIHAAQGVYKSMESRDKRHEQVIRNEITPEESKKLRNKARLQDAAAIGIAALGIKGAYSEWREVQEQRQEMIQQKKEGKERHEKRLRRKEKQENRAREEREARKRGNGGGRGRGDYDGYRTN